MAINLLDLVKGQLNETVVGKMSQIVGAKHSETTSAIDTVLPALLGAVVNKGSDKSGAGSLLNMINTGKHDGGMFDNLAGLLGNTGKADAMMGVGKSLVSSLLGNRQSSILDLVTNGTSLGRNSSSSLMNMLAPMVMGMIGKQVSKNGLDARGLMKMLGGQRSIVEKALPAGFSSALGLAADGHTKAASSSRSTSSTTRTPEREEKKKGGGGFIRILLPILILGALGYFLSRSACGGDTTVDRSKYQTQYVVDATGNLVDKNGKVIKNAGEFREENGFFVDNEGAKIQRGIDVAKEKMNNAADKTKEAVGNATEKTKEAVGNATENAKEAIGGATANAKEAIGNATDKTKDALSNTGDKIANAADKTKTAVTNAAGITAVAAQENFAKLFNTKAVGTAYGLSNITFDTESHRITNMSKEEVEGLAAALKEYPDARIQVQVHTADGGNNIENKTISNLRAKVVKDMLVTLGVDAKQISSKGLSAKDATKAAANVVEVVVQE